MRYVRAQRVMCTTQSSKSTSSLVYLLCIVSCLLCVSFQFLLCDAVVRRTLVLIAFTVAIVFIVAIFCIGFCCIGGVVFTDLEGIQILHTCLQLLREDCADWRKQLCEK